MAGLPLAHFFPKPRRRLVYKAVIAKGDGLYSTGNNLHPAYVVEYQPGTRTIPRVAGSWLFGFPYTKEGRSLLKDGFPPYYYPHGTIRCYKAEALVLGQVYLTATLDHARDDLELYWHYVNHASRDKVGLVKCPPSGMVPLAKAFSELVICKWITLLEEL